MKIINNVNWITARDINLLESSAALAFGLENYKSLDDILTKLSVDVIIEPGIIKRSVPSELKEAYEFWKNKWEMLKKQHEAGEEYGDEYWEVMNKFEMLAYALRIWGEMPLRGYYDPNDNVIKLFPDEMREEYDGKCVDELMISTLAHETMHAYFDRPGHEKFPYAVCVEEPLAEFGMLLYLNETGSKYYNWAYEDVKSKRTCYHYGANLMDQHLNGDKSVRRYLENYKILLDSNSVITKNRNNGSISFPSYGTTINGIVPKWHNLINIPTFFWDDMSRTLGLDGDWIDEIIHEHHLYKKHMLMRHKHMMIHGIKTLYLGENFFIDEDSNFKMTTHVLFHHLDIEDCNIMLSPKNKFYKMVNGRVMTIDNEIAPIYESCGHGLYRIQKNGKLGVFDKEGNQIVPCNYDRIWYFGDNGLCEVGKNGLYGFVNLQGEEQIPIEYDDLFCLRFEEGVSIAKKNGMYGIIDEHNNIVHPFNLNYLDIRGFHNGYATMEDKKGKWGTIDTKGNIVIPCTYDSSIYFDENGIDTVKKDGEEFKIDTTGKRIE